MFDRDDMPSPLQTYMLSWAVIDEGASPVGAGRYVFPVTAGVQAVLARPGWVPSAALGFRLRSLTGSKFLAAPNGAALPVLTITYEPVVPMQGAGTLTVAAAWAGAGRSPNRGAGAGAATAAWTGAGVMPSIWGGRGTLTAAAAWTGAGTRPSRATGAHIAVAAWTGYAATLRRGAGTLVGRATWTVHGAHPPDSPPAPYRDLIRDPDYHAALVARTAIIDARIDIINPNGATIARLGGPAATHPGAVSGTMSVSSERATWWDCDLRIDQTGLIPTQPGDLLHPLTHNRIRLWWRIRLAPTRWAEVPLGVYYVDYPTLADDGGPDPSVAIKGQDASALIARAKLPTSVTVGGMRIGAAIRTILGQAAPWATLNIDPDVGIALPSDYEAAEPGADPWATCLDLAAAGDLVLHVDREGVVQLRPKPSWSARPVASFQAGPGCAALSASSTVPMGSLVNRVTVTTGARRSTNGDELEPLVAVATDDDPTSPLWVGRGYYYDSHVTADEAATQADVQAMADGLLRAGAARVDTGEIVIFPHPHLEPGDVIQVGIPRAGMVGQRQVTGWALALGDLGGQRVELTGRSSWRI